MEELKSYLVESIEVVETTIDNLKRGIHSCPDSLGIYNRGRLLELDKRLRELQDILGALEEI